MIFSKAICMRCSRIGLAVILVASLHSVARAEETHELAQGAALEKRKSLYLAIQAAEKEGIGIKAYMAHFKAIEDSAISSDEKTIVDRLDRLGSALENQLGGKGSLDFYANLNKERVLTDYCKRVESSLSEIFRPLKKEINEHCQLICTVLADGKVENLRVDPEDDCTKATRALVMKKMVLIGRFQAPPKAPLELKMTICEKPEHTEVRTAGDTELDLFSKLMERRIRSKWNRPKGVKGRVKVAFEVDRSGCIKNPKIENSSNVAVLDASALDAIREVSPLPALPDGAPKSVDVDFTFDSNMANRNPR